jgi:hypothetical protein
MKIIINFLKLMSDSFFLPAFDYNRILIHKKKMEEFFFNKQQQLGCSGTCIYCKTDMLGKGECCDCWWRPMIDKNGKCIEHGR